MTLPRLSVLLLLAATATGCLVPDKFLDVDVDGGDDVDAERPPVPYTDVDLLFVIDNSGSMAEEQATLSRSIPSFLNALASSGELPGLHVGVVTSELSIGDQNISACVDPSDDGNLLIAPGCPVDGTFLSDERTETGERVRNYTGGLGDATACMTVVGTDGCGFEQHLEAMRLVLAGERDSSAGFLRDDALLVVVILADEDDCSTSDTTLFDPSEEATMRLGPLPSRCTSQGVSCAGVPPDAIGSYQDCQPNQLSGYVHPAGRYRDFLRDLKPDPRQVLLVTITGVAAPFEIVTGEGGQPSLAPSCTSSGGTAAPAVRINWLSDQVARKHTASICDDIAATMESAASFVRTALDGR